uniref:Cytochrome b n=1 Tax=Pristaulacus compressus TaxID=1414807 RepID=U5TU41_9HYME|nr:cytochrome b [Pristaulacus compressus]AGZ13122.1 cytochrome b [Pristaulacus compressus]
MKKSLFFINPILNNLFKSLINLPTPINISLFWKIGSILGLFLLIQIISGLFISMHYNFSFFLAFSSIIHIMNNINYGWLFRFIHINGATMFFFFLFLHIGRGIYYQSFNLISVWIIGTLIFLLSMMTAFLGYILPWGQMSFWGATVITNLLSTIPFLGNSLTLWIWGGFSIGPPTLSRFYSIHFILPFLILFFIIIHLMFLHLTGSNNPLGTNSNFYKIIFHPYFTFKDLLSYLIISFLFFINISWFPNQFLDPENFLKSNSLITPIHIQPEWYFLFAYSILRSIPNKLGGVIALIFSILIILILPYINMSKFNTLSFFILNQFLFWFFVNSVIILTWIGMCPVNYPFIYIGQIYTIFYFMYFFLNSIIFMIWNKLIF